jgi:cytochrome P450
VFIPDRFLPENKDKIIPGTYIPFGGGPHICAGSAFAQTEALVVMANMIMNYDFELHGHQHVEPAHRLTTCPKNQIQMRIKCRY